MSIKIDDVINAANTPIKNPKLGYVRVAEYKEIERVSAYNTTKPDDTFKVFYVERDMDGVIVLKNIKIPITGQTTNQK